MTAFLLVPILFCLPALMPPILSLFFLSLKSFSIVFFCLFLPFFSFQFLHSPSILTPLTVHSSSPPISVPFLVFSLDPHLHLSLPLCLPPAGFSSPIVFRRDKTISYFRLYYFHFRFYSSYFLCFWNYAVFCPLSLFLRICSFVFKLPSFCCLF